MAYNIDTITILKSDGFAIPRPRWEELVEKHSNEVPESSVLDDDFPKRCCEEHRGLLFVNSFPFHGEGSGSAIDLLVETILPAFLGSADLLLIWEGGDSTSGLRLLNGKVTRHEVVSALGKETK